MPVLHQRSLSESDKIFPSEDILLHSGDRLIVLATLTGLLNIEQGIMAPRNCYVRVEKAIAKSSAFEGTMILARISGCELGMAKTLMECLPGTLPVPLYRQQAQRLVFKLSQSQILAQEIQTE